MIHASRAIVAAVLTLGAAPARAAQTVWREGEKPDRSTMNRHPWWYDQVKKDQLSGGDWISNFSDEKAGSVEYSVTIPEAKRYAFWLRANPVQAKLDYAMDRGAWTPIDLTVDLIDTVNVAADGKPDLRFLAWKKVGELELTRGRHVVRFRTDASVHHHGAIDAFVFTAEPFVPRGTAARPIRSRQGAGARAGGWRRHLAVHARARYLPRRCVFRPALAQREGRRRVRVRPALGRRQRLRPRRRCAGPILGREHRRPARSQPRGPCPSRPVPRQARASTSSACTGSSNRTRRTPGSPTPTPRPSMRPGAWSPR